MKRKMTDMEKWNKIAKACLRAPFIHIAIVHALKTQHEAHFKRVNQIMNKYSKPMDKGGLNYVKAFEEMEKYETELSLNLPKV